MEESIKFYRNILEIPALCVLHVDESFVWGDDLINTQFSPAGMPIFLIDLQMDEQKPFYSTNPEKFLVSVFSFVLIMNDFFFLFLYYSLDECINILVFNGI